MKVLAALLIAACTSASGQQVQETANVATKLYLGCVQATLQGTVHITPTRVGINQFVTEIDNRCLAWMVIWYRPLVGEDIIKLRPDALSIITKNRLRILQELTEQIRKEALR